MKLQDAADQFLLAAKQAMAEGMSRQDVRLVMQAACTQLDDDVENWLDDDDMKKLRIEGIGS